MERSSSSGKLKETFLSLVRLGIGHAANALPQSVDWNEVKALAEKQGLYAVVMDGTGNSALPEA